ncbi:MAG: TIGR03088 family PEP-CTERM/XrtA system glycosyltransferase [Massilia sp.]
MLQEAPLIVHLIYRLDFGGLENLMVERINRMPAKAYRHAIVCLTDYTGFAKKISKPGVGLYALHKQPGLSLGTHAALFKLLRRLKPAILHSYNLSAIEYAPVALAAGVPVRINGAHGRDAADPQGRNKKHNALRRAMVPFYDCCYANSADMLEWNRSVIKVPDHKSRLLANGIDTDKFHPRSDPQSPRPHGFGAECIVIGTVGRIQDVKNHASLVDAFIALRERLPEQRDKLRLAIVGDGPLLPALRAKVEQAGIAELVWLPGARNDVADILRSLDIFAMSSIAEGTPGSALEAMASGLPVVGTRVGGIPEVIDDGVTGALVPASHPQAMAAAFEPYVRQLGLAPRHGAAGRQRVLNKYNMTAMVAGYQSLYDALCDRKKTKKGP